MGNILTKALVDGLWKLLVWGADVVQGMWEGFLPPARKTAGPACSRTSKVSPIQDFLPIGEHPADQEGAAEAERRAAEAERRAAEAERRAAEAERRAAEAERRAAEAEQGPAEVEEGEQQRCDSGAALNDTQRAKVAIILSLGSTSDPFMDASFVEMALRFHASSNAETRVFLLGDVPRGVKEAKEQGTYSTQSDLPENVFTAAYEATVEAPTVVANLRGLLNGLIEFSQGADRLAIVFVDHGDETGRFCRKGNVVMNPIQLVQRLVNRQIEVYSLLLYCSGAKAFKESGLPHTGVLEFEPSIVARNSGHHLGLATGLAFLIAAKESKATGQPMRVAQLPEVAQDVANDVASRLEKESGCSGNIQDLSRLCKDKLVVLLEDTFSLSPEEHIEVLKLNDCPTNSAMTTEGKKLAREVAAGAADGVGPLERTEGELFGTWIERVQGMTPPGSLFYDKCERLLQKEFEARKLKTKVLYEVVTAEELMFDIQGKEVPAWVARCFASPALPGDISSLIKIPAGSPAPPRQPLSSAGMQLEELSSEE